MKVLFLVLFSFSIVCLGQQNNDSLKTDLKEEMKKLVELNSFTESLIDLSGKEAVNISENTTVKQMIELTAPYINSKILNSKKLSLFLLFHAFSNKAKKLSERRKIVEIVCRNYLNEDEIQLLSNFLSLLREKDFSRIAKKQVAELIYSKSNYAENSKWLAYAQITQSIPYLWKSIKKNSKTLKENDLTVLASLARLGERGAGFILCDYYNSRQNRTDYQYVFTAKQIAFSLDKNVLNCLINDFKTMALDWNFRDGDTGFQPAQVVGSAITEMIKNYPYKKGEYNVDNKQLLEWLNQTTKYELNDK